MKTPVLKTSRLVLRPVSLDDAPAIQKHFNNWNIIKNLSEAVPWPYPDDGAESFLQEIALPKVEQGVAHVWGIFEAESAPDAGLIGLVDYHVEYQDDGGNRGFWLAEPYWGRGYMTEAVMAVQDWLFFEKGIENLIVVNAVDNVGSRRVKEKSGGKFLRNGKLMHKSGTDDTEIWEITKESWAKSRGVTS